MAMNGFKKTLLDGFVGVSCFIFIVSHANADIIYVANTGNNTIEKFDTSGNDTGTVFAPAHTSANSSGAGQIARNLYVADFGTGAIQKIDPAGNVSPFANTGLDEPYALAFDTSGNLYVANRGNNTIEKFNSSGQGAVFASSGLLNGPQGLAFDSNGNLYVSLWRQYDCEIRFHRK